MGGAPVRGGKAADRAAGRLRGSRRWEAALEALAGRAVAPSMPVARCKVTLTMVDARIAVRIYFDDEAQNWHFYVPELHIVGGSQRTHDEALQAAAEAVAFALEAEPEGGHSDEFEYLNVAVG
jgi:hypothetical protein